MQEEELKGRYGEVQSFFDEKLRHAIVQGHRGVELRGLCQHDSEGEGVLLLLGGRTEFAEKYAELIHDLRTLPLRICSFDHRGQGLSERLLDDEHKGHVEQFDDYVEDLHLFLDAMVGAEEKIYILAHSMGGAVALRYAQRYPGRLQAMVLSSPMLGINCFPLTENFMRIICRRAVLAGRGGRYIVGGGPYREIGYARNVLTSSRTRFDINQDLVRVNPAVALGSPTNAWLYASLTVCETILNEARNVAVPVLLLQSGADRVVKAAAQHRFAALAPHCRLQVIDGARHELLMERDVFRDQALAAIMDFFATLGVRRPIAAESAEHQAA